MPSLMPIGRQQYFNNAGVPLSGGKIYTYAAGTTTPKATYSDAAGATPNANPVVLDARGEALIFWDGAYNVVVKDASDALIYSVDNYADPSSLISALRSDLASTSDSSKGVSLVGGASRVVSSVAALRALPKTGSQNVLVSGYYAAGDGGGGLYYYDSTDTTSVDNGGSIIVASDGGRWKLSQTGAYSVKQFGAKGDNTNNDTSACQAAIDTGHSVYFPDGQYKTTLTLTVSTASQRIFGESRLAIIKPATDFDAITVAAALVAIENLRITGKATNTTSTSAGIKVTNCTRGLFKFLLIEFFGYGINMQGATSNWVNRIDNCFLYTNYRAGVYGCGHSTTIVGGEIAGSVYGVMQAKLKAGTALAVDRDYTSDLGTNIVVDGVVLETIYESKAITGTANSGGQVRITCVGHGFTTGDYISVSSVAGTTEANGVWPITVIDADHFDLKTSAYVNAYTSGGTARRGVAVYSGVNTSGIRTINCYFEDITVVAQFGDAYKNDGVTSNASGPTFGGSVERCYIGSAAIESALVAVGAADQLQVIGNQCVGTSCTLINTRNTGSIGEIQKFGNIGFTREYDATGPQIMRGMILKPVTKNSDPVFEVQIPNASGSSTLATAIQVTNYSGATYTTYVASNALFGGYIKGASNITINFGSGSPNGVVSAFPGSLFLRSDGGAATSVYVKESGAGTNTGWVGK